MTLLIVELQTGEVESPVQNLHPQELTSGIDHIDGGGATHFEETGESRCVCYMCD